MNVIFRFSVIECVPDLNNRSHKSDYRMQRGRYQFISPKPMTNALIFIIITLSPRTYYHLLSLFPVFVVMWAAMNGTADTDSVPSLIGIWSVQWDDFEDNAGNRKVENSAF